MTCLLSSQGLVIATTMVVSTTILFLTFSKQLATPKRPKDRTSDDPSQNLRPSLCSGRTRGADDGKKKKKKKVQFAENVKDPKGNGDEYRREKGMMANLKEEKENNDPRHGLIGKMPCRVEIEGGMPANRIALYNGILRDRVHRLECSR